MTMTTPTSSVDTYRAQLTRWARAMALGNDAEVLDALDEGYSPRRFAMFVDGNREKRFELMKEQLAFVAGAFPNMDDLLADYLSEHPMAAFDTGTTDGDRFLGWLGQTQKLTRVQRDYLACQRARHAVEEAGRKLRRAHLRFQELWSVADDLSGQLGGSAGLRIHLNPVRAGARFRTRALLDRDLSPPADVLFFPVRHVIHAAVLDGAARAVVDNLAAAGPCTLDEWAALGAPLGREELIPLGRDLAATGLIAFS
jgi:hypothetical protein